MSDGDWRTVEPWWRSAVVYQVYPRSFADSDGDGVGDLRGVLSRLDHLSDLGVDALWLSPFYPSPQVDNGYDISDYRNVDPVFGTLADLDELVHALHERGMRLIIDIVVNHTSDQHPWFLASRSSRDDPKRGWYYWRDGAGTAPPNNWGSLFSGPAWQHDDATGQWYLHTFAVEQPDLDWQDEGLRAAVHDMLRWWLDRGVDGFRLDVISMIAKAPGLPDGEVAAGARYAPPSPGFAPSLHDRLQELHREVLAGRDVMTVGETPGITVAEAVRMTDPQRHELDMVFEFEHVSLDHGATKWDVRDVPLPELKACFAKWQAGLAERGWNSLYWDNHDQPRVGSRFGDDGAHRVASATTLATVLHLHRGTPYVYQGDEIGMTNAGFTRIDDYRDVESLRAYAEQIAAGREPGEMLRALAASSRDNARTPMQWDGGPHAGFTSGTPWIAVNANAAEVNVAAQQADPSSVLSHYRRLIALRHELPVVALGDFTLLVPEHPRLWAFVRRHDDVELLVVANCSADELNLRETGLEVSGDLLLANLPSPQSHPVPPHPVPSHPVEAHPVESPSFGPHRLRPWESRIYRRPLGEEQHG